MAIAKVHTDTFKDLANSPATLTLVMPTGAVSTDIAIATITSDFSTTITPPAGWTRVGSQVKMTAGNTVCVDVFVSLGNNTNMGFGVSGSGTGNSIGSVVSCFSGVDNTTPIDVAGSGNTVSGTNTLTMSAITIVTANAWELIAAGDFNGGVFSATSFTVSENTHTNAAAALLYNTTPKGTGSTGTVALDDSASTTNQIMCALAFALRPATATTALLPYLLTSPYEDLSLIEDW